MKEIIQLLREDLLKGIYSLLRAARDPRTDQKAGIPISAGLLLLLSAVLALIRTMYGPANYGITQHFVSTFAILLSFYLVIGITVLLLHLATLEQINKYAATIFTCLLATGIFYFMSVVLFGFFTGSFLDWVDNNVLPPWLRDTAITITIEEWLPAILFSLFGCWLVIIYNHRVYRNLLARTGIYFLFTTSIFYYAVFDRGGFFDNVMKIFSNISL